MKKTSLFIFLLISINFYSQKKAEDFGFRYFQYIIENDTVEVLVKSKKGEENIKKPLFFSVQGSLAIPLIIHNGKNRTIYSTTEEGFVEDDYHLAIVNKSGIPLIAHKDSLVDQREFFIDKENYIYPEKYVKNNNLEYYVHRNLKIIDSLQKEKWVDTTKLIVSGHSQGSSIALFMCDKSTKPTHLIYSSGLPYYSTILALLHRERMKEKYESNPKVKKIFNTWKEVVNDPTNYKNSNRDSNLMLSSFSQNESEVLKRVKIPILISYGTKDESSPYQDMFQIETIKERITNITFLSYVGLGHTYQRSNPEKENKKTDYLVDVVNDWLKWLEKN